MFPLQRLYMFCQQLWDFLSHVAVSDNINVNTVSPPETNEEKSVFDLFDLGALHSTLDIWDRCRAWGIGVGGVLSKSPGLGIRGSALVSRVTPP